MKRFKGVLKVIVLTLLMSSIESCDKLSSGLILNDTEDIIKIELIADASKNTDASGNNLTFSGYCDFDYSNLSNLEIIWNEPIFISRFTLEPKSSFRLGGSLGMFSIENIYYDTLRIKTKLNTKEYFGKQQIFEAFKKGEKKNFYLKIE
jgi:hypothetical protein